jgi:hypothetical protein
VFRIPSERYANTSSQLIFLLRKWRLLSKVIYYTSPHSSGLVNGVQVKILFWVINVWQQASEQTLSIWGETARMIQTLQKEVKFDEFIAWYPENIEHGYEFHYGVIAQIPKPKGKHSKLAGFIIAELSFLLRQYKLPLFITRECIIKSVNGKSGYEADVIVLDEAALVNY